MKILHLEDSPLDAELVGALLRKSGVSAAVDRAVDRASFEAALRAGGYQVILADFHIPGFDGLEALRLAQAVSPEVPFLFLSGTIGEEVAIESLKAGATDYVLKHRIDRLAPSVRRALEEARLRAERRSVETELRENDRRKDEFLAMLAHELRNPLAAISNAARLARHETGEALGWSLDIVERQVRNLAHLIDDLLDVSRITQGKIALRCERIDASVAVNNALDAVRPLIQERGHALEARVEPGLWMVGDPVRLEQVLTNLLTNAAKYTECGGRVALEAAREGDEVALRVKDTGIGIPAEALPRMFDLFVQGDRTLARSEGGLGIGLTLVKRLAEMHGGRVTARSDGPGRGSEFIVFLPACPRSAEDPRVDDLAERAGRPSAGPARGSRVLVVDDNVDTARAMSRLIGREGHDVRVAHDGPSALQEAWSHRPEVVLLDIGLPGMDGYEVIDRLRRDGGAEALIVAVSGYGQKEDFERSRSAGFDHHLVKPVDFQAILDLVNRDPARM